MEKIKRNKIIIIWVVERGSSRRTERRGKRGDKGKVERAR